MTKLELELELVVALSTFTYFLRVLLSVALRAVALVVAPVALASL